MSDQFSLDHWLGRAYHANHTGASVDEKFIDRLKNDEALRIEAGKRLASLPDSITDRDYISRVHRETLERLLPQVNQNG